MRQPAMSKFLETWIRARCVFNFPSMLRRVGHVCVRQMMGNVLQAYSWAAWLTWSHMIMTFILCSEGDQMRWAFSCQATAELRAQWWRWGGDVLSQLCFITLRATAPSLISLPCWERKHSVSECYQFVEQCEQWTRTSCEPRLTAAQSSGTLLFIYNGSDVSVCLLSEAKGWTLVNMLTDAWRWGSYNRDD